jgi:hypothetical protein
MPEKREDADAAQRGLAPRRAYTSPKVIDYGSVTKLTQGTRSVVGDSSGQGFVSKFK